jgi:heme-degrading monooxygenase HmoA
VIARTWRGVVHARDADSYVDYLNQTGFANLGSAPGNLAWLGLRRASGDRAEFLLVSLWSSHEAIRRFAGADPERAVFYPEDECFLIEKDERVNHFEVIHLSSLDGPAEKGGAQRAARALSAWLSHGGIPRVPGSSSFGRPTPHGFTYVRLP